eukprot:COSAG02_NODE_427_length_22498_cov_11.745212_9_plen_150_part_00
MCPLRNVLVDPRYMHGGRVVGPRKISRSSAGEKPARSTARGGKSSTGRGRGGRGGGRQKSTIPPQQWQPLQRASPQAAGHIQPWNIGQPMGGSAGVAPQPQGQPVGRPRSRGDGRAPRVGGRVRGRVRVTPVSTVNPWLLASYTLTCSS